MLPMKISPPRKFILRLRYAVDFSCTCWFIGGTTPPPTEPSARTEAQTGLVDGAVPYVVIMLILIIVVIVLFIAVIVLALYALKKKGGQTNKTNYAVT